MAALPFTTMGAKLQPCIHSPSSLAVCGTAEDINVGCVNVGCVNVGCVNVGCSDVGCSDVDSSDVDCSVLIRFGRETFNPLLHISVSLQHFTTTSVSLRVQKPWSKSSMRTPGTPLILLQPHSLSSLLEVEDNSTLA